MLTRMRDYNIQTNETICDQRLAEMLGFNLDDVQEHLPWWESLTHPDDWPRVIEIFNAHLEGLTPIHEAEFRVRPKLGDWKWVLALGSVVERDEEGKPIRATGTYLDISERKLAESALRESEERFRAMFDGAQDMIFMMDSHLRYMQVNLATTRMLGLDESEILDASPRISMAQELDNSFDCWISGCSMERPTKENTLST